jgi:hypothetical protein
MDKVKRHVEVQIIGTDLDFEAIETARAGLYPDGIAVDVAPEGLLPIFHYSLKAHGLLFPGSSETIGPCTDLYEVLDKRWKIFRRKEGRTARPILLEIPAQRLVGDEGAKEPARHARSHKQVSNRNRVEQLEREGERRGGLA